MTDQALMRKMICVLLIWTWETEKNEKGSQKSLCITGGPSSQCDELLSLLNLYANVQRVKRDKLPPTSTIT